MINLIFKYFLITFTYLSVSIYLYVFRNSLDFYFTLWNIVKLLLFNL